MLNFHARLDRIFKQRISFSIFFRIWLSIAIVIVLASSLAYYQLQKSIKPAAQRVVEDTLVDISRMLAVSLGQMIELTQIAYPEHVTPPHTPLTSNQLPPYSLTNLPFRTLVEQRLNQIFTPPLQTHNQSQNAPPNNGWFTNKTQSQLHIYVTDAAGLVLYDSQQQHIGQDFSRWNDVYLTLHGKYGARSTRTNPNDPSTSVMYVASPILDSNGQLLGVVSVGKPVATLTPYIQASQNEMIKTLLSITALLLVFAVLAAGWLRHSIELVNRYTQNLAKYPVGNDTASQTKSLTTTAPPFFYLGKELNQLIVSIDAMKLSIENKAYVTDYVHTLTHELKSPLTAIRACAELLSDDMPAADREQFSHTIMQQSDKLQQLVERLLMLAKIEQPNFRLTLEPFDVATMLAAAVANQQAWLQQKSLNYTYLGKPNIMANVDRFWLSQALQNLLDNAIKFAQKTIVVVAICEQERLTIWVINDCPPVPDFVLHKAFERYFSLPATNSSSRSAQSPRPPKGTGLGLTLTQQVVQHHHGTIVMQQKIAADLFAEILPTAILQTSDNGDRAIPTFTPSATSSVNPSASQWLHTHDIDREQNCIVLILQLPLKN